MVAPCHGYLHQRPDTWQVVAPKPAEPAAAPLEIPLAARKRAGTLIADNDIMNTKLKPKTVLPQAMILSISPES